MTAKEMFEKLGFNYRKELYEKDKLIEIQFNNYNGTWVTISKEKIEYVKDHDKSKLPLNLLKVINKQIEELGWDNE